MEADDILTNQMKICRPELPILLCTVAVCIITDTGDIVGQGIQPYIHHMSVIKINGNPPLKGGSGHTQILQSGQKEIVHHLVLSGNRLNEFGMFVDMLNQLIRIFTHTEEISFFLGRLYFSSAVGTLAVHKLAFGPEGLTGSTIQAFISPLINISLLIQAPENLLYLLLMVRIRGTDKLIIRYVQQVAQTANGSCHIIHKLFGSHARFLCLDLNLLPVLVCTGLEENIISFLSLKPCNTVCQYDFIIIANMRLTGSVSNGCCQIIRSFVLHLFLSFPTKKTRLTCVISQEDELCARGTTSLRPALTSRTLSGLWPVRAGINPIRYNRRNLSQPYPYGLGALLGSHVLFTLPSFLSAFCRNPHIFHSICGNTRHPGMFSV